MQPRTFSPPIEVPKKQMQEYPARVLDERHEFYMDILRRLECTPAGKALRYEFASYDEAQKYRRFVSNRALRKIGRGMIKCHVAYYGDAVYVYFSHGKNWQPITQERKGKT